MDSHWYSQSVMSVSRSLSGRLSGNYLLTDTNCVWTTLWNIYMLKRLTYSSVAYNFTAWHGTVRHITNNDERMNQSLAPRHIRFYPLRLFIYYYSLIDSSFTQAYRIVLGESVVVIFFPSARAKRINENQPEKYEIIIRQSEMNEPKINGLAADRFVCVRDVLLWSVYVTHRVEQSPNSINLIMITIKTTSHALHLIRSVGRAMQQRLCSGLCVGCERHQIDSTVFLFRFTSNPKILSNKFAVMHSLWRSYLGHVHVSRFALYVVYVRVCDDQ